LVQALPHPPAELVDGGGQPCELFVPVRLRFEAPRLLLELLPASFEVTIYSGDFTPNDPV
jgi:hypothetical protein